MQERGDRPIHDEGDLSDSPSHGHRLRFALAVALPFLLLAGGLLWRATWRDGPSEIVLATGGRTGTYFPYGKALGEVLEEEMDGVSVEVRKTGGSLANVDLLVDGTAHFAFLQSNVLSRATVGENGQKARQVKAVSSFRTVARLYEEVLQIVVRKDSGILELQDLEGRPVYVGAADSGTAETAELLFHHFHTAPRYIHEVSDSLSDSPSDPATRALLESELDAAIFVAGLRTRAVEELLDTGQTTLLSLGDISRPGSAVEGASLSMPGTRPSVVPRHTYGTEPPEAVGTLAVDALLVTRAERSTPLVRRVTELLFENKFRLARAHSAASDLTELQDSRGLRFSLHPGAANYYARNDPPFFVTYAESISLLVTLLLTGGSGFLAFREWMKRRKKNRIDVHYLELDGLSRRIRRSRDSEDLTRLREDLYRLRRRAFRELVSERIEADESFTIFQDFLGQELREVDRWLDRSGRSPIAS